MFEEIDENGGGQILFDAFCTYFARLKASESDGTSSSASAPSGEAMSSTRTPFGLYVASSQCRDILLIATLKHIKGNYKTLQNLINVLSFVDP